MARVYSAEELKLFQRDHPEVQQIVNNVRIEERYLANKIMGDLGIPAANRGKIYTEAGEIVMSMILAPPKEETQNPDS